MLHAWPVNSDTDTKSSLWRTTVATPLYKEMVKLEYMPSIEVA